MGETAVSLRIIILCVMLPAGALIAAMAIPMIRRKVPPNSAYGFRVARTLADPKVWYEANEFSGRCLFWIGLAVIVASLGFFFFPVGDIAYSWICLVVMMSSVAVGLILSYRHLNRITRTE